jgi:hypothetical protein
MPSIAVRLSCSKNLFMLHTDNITVKQAVDYILAQPDGKEPTRFYLKTHELMFFQRTRLPRKWMGETADMEVVGPDFPASLYISLHVKQPRIALCTLDRNMLSTFQSFWSCERSHYCTHFLRPEHTSWHTRALLLADSCVTKAHLPLALVQTPCDTPDSCTAVSDTLTNNSLLFEVGPTTRPAYAQSKRLHPCAH